MAYYFFFSYKRVKNSEYQRAFFADLCKEVSDQIEADENTPEVGFLDQSSIDPGEDWGQALAGALQESKVLVCAISEKYVESKYCGKEWQLFQMRREEYEQRRKTQGVQNPPLPPFIKPVLWIPFLVETATEINKIQLYRGTKEHEANRLGLMQLIKLKRKTKLYKGYIIELAKDIIAAAKFDLPPLPNLPLIGEVPSAFVRPQANPLAALQAQQQVPAPIGPGTPVRVKFIVVAGDPNTFAGQRQPDAYLPNGGPDWKPFHPSVSDSIADIIRRFDDNADVDYQCDVAPLSNDLVSVTQEAYRHREIVVIIVDAWTLSWNQDYRTILRDFDEQNKKDPFYNATVLVPWNEADLEIKHRRDDILDKVGQTFDSRHTIPGFYRDSITSVQDLLTALRESITNIRAQLHSRVEERKPVAQGISKPEVSNQTTVEGGA